MKDELKSTIADIGLSNINNIEAHCNECGRVVYDTHWDKPATSQSFLSALVTAKVKKHITETDHTDIGIIIDRKPEPVMEDVDVNIVVK